VQRSSRRARALHAAAYLLTIPLLLTGWWLLLGREGDPSPLARALGASDPTIHRWLGYGLAAAGVAALAFGTRGIASFVRETLRVDRGDVRWWRRLPSAAFTGRFARHEGHFDPGQRVANVVIVLGLLVLVGSGVGLTVLHGGPTFALLARIHRWSTFVVTPAIAIHVLVVLGVLPGYRGVWRAMHRGGRVSVRTAQRLWPAWTERALGAEPDRDPAGPVSGERGTVRAWRSRTASRRSAS
jgi:formate dehydrogenase subunit gamma